MGNRRLGTRSLCFSALTSLLAPAAAALFAIPATMSMAVTLTATALYMGGTEHPLISPPDSPAYITRYVDWARDNLVGPSQLCVGGDPGCTDVAVYTPEQFWPITGLRSMRFDASVTLGVANLNDCLRENPCTTSAGEQTLTDSSYTVFGYSQSATIAGIQKSAMIAHPVADEVSFVFLSNPNRPNGGILERFAGLYIPILGVSFNGATVTDSPDTNPLLTVDVVHQYDPIGDFPTNPLNLLADLNALLGFVYEHPEFGTGTPMVQGAYQDTTYYLIPTDTLPLVRPLTIVPFLGPLLATVLDPPLRVLVETGFDRTINPGAPTPAKWLYFPNPIKTVVDFLMAIPTGWDNGIAYLTGDAANRPFGTAIPGPYGVGGPAVNAGEIDRTDYGPPTPALALFSARPTAGSASAALRPRIRAATTTTAHRAGPRPAVQADAAGDAAAARATVENRSARSATGPLRNRAWSAQ